MFKSCIRFCTNFAKLGTLPRLSSTMSASRIVWMDMEMTGLDIDKDHIMEVACLVTDGSLDIVAEGPNLILHQPDAILNNMNEWCIKQHGKTGLTEASRMSTISVQEAEETLFTFITQHVVENCSPLAGNSVYMDRLFLRKYMPRINDYLHYRIIDVSTIKELCRMWKPELHKNVPAKCFKHRALQDIQESVNELKFYKTHIENLRYDYKSADLESTPLLHTILTERSNLNVTVVKEAYAHVFSE